VLVDSQHGAWLGLAGLGTFLAVALHKPLDVFAITSVMSNQKWSQTAQNLPGLRHTHDSVQPMEHHSHSH